MNILVEFIPQIIFLVFLFGYLCILMFIKWTKYYAGAEDRKNLLFIYRGKELVHLSVFRDSYTWMRTFDSYHVHWHGTV